MKNFSGGIRTDTSRAILRDLFIWEVIKLAISCEHTKVEQASSTLFNQLRLNILRMIASPILGISDVQISVFVDAQKF